MKYLVVVLFFLAWSTPFLSAEQAVDEFDEAFESDWQDESDYQLSHELSYGYATILSSDSVNVNDEVLNELRGKSDLVYQAEKFTFNLNVELLHDQLLDKTDFNIYQMSFLVPFDNGTDVKIGRQVITWGTGDLLFLNDLFSKDWQSFFSGREDTYLKPPVDAIRTSFYGSSFNLDLALLPEFEADNIPTGERYSFFLPGQGLVQPQPILTAQKETGPEISARLFANKNGIEWAIYAYSGFFKSPSQIDEFGTLGFNKMSALGASIRMPLAGGLFNSEVVVYQSKDDKAGTDPFVANGQSRYLIGFETEIANELTMGVQAYLEKTADHQALLNNLLTSQLAPKENRTMLTLRLTQQALQQKLLNSLMMFYSPSDNDYYLRYSTRYNITDHWKIIVGLNWLNGKDEQTFLAQMQDNSNLFFRVHYNFG